MIINHRYGFIFLHVPKNAGTAITSWLSQFTGWNDIELGSTPYGEAIQPIYGERFHLHKHSTAAQIRRVIGDVLWDQYFTFAVVRHPLDRLVSAYHFYRQWQHPSTDAVRAFDSFEAFVLSDYFRQDVKNPTRPGGLQSEFLRTDRAHPIDRICRFESLQQDLTQVAQQLGLSKPVLRRVNESKRGRYERYYTPQALAVARAVFREDFERFGYEIPEQLLL